MTPGGAPSPPDVAPADLPSSPLKLDAACHIPGALPNGLDPAANQDDVPPLEEGVNNPKPLVPLPTPKVIPLPDPTVKPLVPLPTPKAKDPPPVPFANSFSVTPAPPAISLTPPSFTVPETVPFDEALYSPQDSVGELVGRKLQVGSPLTCSQVVWLGAIVCKHACP